MNEFFLKEVMPRAVICIVMLIACAGAIIAISDREDDEPIFLFLLRNGLGGAIFGTLLGNILGYYLTHG